MRASPGPDVYKLRMTSALVLKIPGDVSVTF